MDESFLRRVGLSALTLADKPFYQQALSTLAQPISDYSFANMFIWSSSLGLYWRRMDRHLCVFANSLGDLTMLMPPLAEAGATSADLRDCLGHCFDVMDSYNDRHADRTHSRIEYVSDELLERIHDCGSTPLNLSTSPMSGDYIYPMTNMIELPGGALKSKRHAKHKFERDYPDHRLETITPAHHAACFALLDLWQQRGDASHEGQTNDAHVGTNLLRARETVACRTAIEHGEQLGLRGTGMFVGDQMIGFTFGEALSPLQASILIEKTHPDFHGAPQMIFSEFCRTNWASYPECNVGDDWGIPTLRFTKESYRPSRRLNKYSLSRPVPSMVGYTPATPEPAVRAPEPQPAPTPPASSQPQACRVRPATNEDIDQILDLEALCFTEPGERFSRRQIRYLIHDAHATVLVAEDRVGIAGWAVGLVRFHRSCRSGRLYGLAVHPMARGRRIGEGLTLATMQALTRLGVGRMYLEVRTDNDAAIRLYRKLGFTDHEPLPHYYGPNIHGFRMKQQLIAHGQVRPDPTPPINQN